MKRRAGMITNERQLKISKKQVQQLREALDTADLEVIEKRVGSRILAKAEIDALQSQVDDLTQQIDEYELLKVGAVRIIKADSLSELPLLLIKARIAQGMSQKQLAEKLGCKEQQVQRYESENYATASLRRLQEISTALDLNISEIGEIDYDYSESGTQDNLIEWDKFPIEEMYRRNWFDDFSESLSQAKAESKTLITDLFSKAGGRPRIVFHKKKVRSGSTLDPFALVAWQCRVLSLANESQLTEGFELRKINDSWFSELAQLSRFPDGPVRACDFIRNAGIAVIIEPHLSRTHLDGAALLGKDGPVIGLTLRYDRIDNFWFVLFHELVHVRMHLRRGKLEQIFDDLDASGDSVEDEADQLAGDALIPEEAWESALPRFLRTAETITAFARDQKIHEAIVAGRIRKESDNYVLFNDLIGRGEVRRLFPHIKFTQ